MMRIPNLSLQSPNLLQFVLLVLGLKVKSSGLRIWGLGRMECGTMLRDRNEAKSLPKPPSHPHNVRSNAVLHLVQFDQIHPPVALGPSAHHGALSLELVCVISVSHCCVAAGIVSLLPGGSSHTRSQPSYAQRAKTSLRRTLHWAPC